MKLPHTTLRVVIAVLGGLLVGGLLILLSTFDWAVKPWNTLLSTSGAVVLTVGLVDLVFELLLRRSLATELMELVDADRNLLRAGVHDFTSINEIEWQVVVDGAKSFLCFVTDPTQFENTVWPLLLSSSGQRRRHLQIVIPDSNNEDTVRDLASRLGVDEASCIASLTHLRDAIEAQWNASTAVDRQQSSLEIRQINPAPRHSLMRSDRGSALVLEPLDRATGHASTYALLFKHRDDDFGAAAWLVESSDALLSKASAPLYAKGTSIEASRVE